jgi:hypothetical protein
MDHASTIISHLFSVGRLTLPGIGGLNLIRVPAKRMVHESKIYGPTILLEFQAQDDPDQALDSVQTAQNPKIQKSITKILNDLLNFEESNILNLGRFHKNQNGQFAFDADPELRRTLEKAYPDLEIKILSGKKKQPEKVITTSESFLRPQYDMKKKIGWFFPLIALIATSLLIACLVSCFLQKKFDNAFINAGPAIQIAGDSSSETPIVVDSAKQMATDTFGPADDVGITGLGMTDSMDLTESPDTADDVFYDEFEVMTDANFKNIENLSLDYVLQESATKRLSYDNPCIIVVGSYLRRDLLNNMVKQLNQLEHNIYIEKYGAFYRTAIIYDCNQINTKIFLAQIREELEPKAWILEY